MAVSVTCPMDLTEEQQRIVNHVAGHARVSAVAGSGKTTLVARIGHLLQRGTALPRRWVKIYHVGSIPTSTPFSNLARTSTKFDIRAFFMPSHQKRRLV